MLKFGHIELFVRDPLNARQFYEEVLGFEVVDVQGDAFVWLKIDAIEILLRRGTPPPLQMITEMQQGQSCYTRIILLRWSTNFVHAA